jgi:hypothetical protein
MTIDAILWAGLGWTVLSMAFSFGCGWWLKSLREKADGT